MKSIKAKEITQEQLIRAFQASTKTGSSIRYGFILGAGASVKSNIPSGFKLAQKWHSEILEDISDDQRKYWEDIKEESLAEHYTKIFKKRFEASYKVGYEELQSYIDKAEPSVGYSFLAKALDETANKFIITTNFDTMVEDALFGLKKSKPLVLGHELLSQYINPISPSRPTIIKIHRDFLFDPYNTDEEIEELDKNWQTALEPVLSENAMIVLGYGGNDDSLMNYLKEIKNRKSLYWCYRGDKDNLSEKILDVLTEKDFIIQIKGFDNFMLSLNDKLEFEPIIDRENIEESNIVKNALEYAKRYEKQLEELSKEDLTKEEQEAVKKLLPYWWNYEYKAEVELNSEKKEEIYREGLDAHPNSHELMYNYAILLKRLGRYEESKYYYEKALVLEEDDVEYNGNYANLLVNLKRYKDAEKYYQKALRLDPKNINNNGNYAQFLLNRGKKEESINYIKICFENMEEENDLTVELWFYRLAHFPEYFEEAQQELDRLLEKGCRSIGWNFRGNIKRAKEEGHPDISLLEEYSNKITAK